jgi:hypothetical protein
MYPFLIAIDRGIIIGVGKVRFWKEAVVSGEVALRK